MLNKPKGKLMYPWVTHTWNPIRGRCPHGCVYCYMRGKSVGDLRLDKKCLNDNLGSGRTIFVGSSTDMWAEKVPASWIENVLNHCSLFQNNFYFFQTKNPERFPVFLFPPQSAIGITIESNRHYREITKAIPPLSRVYWFQKLEWPVKFVNIEPVMEFDLHPLLALIDSIEPTFVSIGADTRGCGLPEPSAGKIKEIISELRKTTQVRLKPNLKRLLNDPGRT